MIKQEKENKQNINPFPAMEEQVLGFWDRGKIFEKSVDKEAPRGDYVFYDGPPFATGSPHYGHIVASAMKDVVPRYWTMKGYRVERKWGWDCHGLPIENIVEKEMGSKSKKDIEKIGVEKFNEICRSKVLGYVDEWEKVIRRLGRWADMKNAYKTMDLDFMESVWWVFKQLWDKGLVYEDYRVTYICPRCETTLSQQEVSEGYKNISEESIIVKFELADEPGVYLLAWTTTPWTLPGNSALYVNPKITYIKVKPKDKADYYIVAKERIDIFEEEVEVIREFKAKDLVGKAYKPLFNYFVGFDDKYYHVDFADFVTVEEGTGLVHSAIMYGDVDFERAREQGLKTNHILNMDGHFKNEVMVAKGLFYKDADPVIIKDLQKRNLAYKTMIVEHSYPHCWRCETPLLNYAITSWFVAVTKVKSKALKLAQKINWFPAHIKDGRFGNWLEGARDWSISRQRFWASVMPIWRCVCGQVKVFGSVAELEKISGKKIIDLHKHTLDKIIFPCEKCGETMKRIPDVLDTWFDSGSMPYAQGHYPFENKKKFEANFPAEFIAEGVDQTRAWFYYLHVIATAIKDNRAFNNVIVNGIVLAEDGKKMSKRLKNYPDPMEIFNKFGADAMRFYLISSPVMAAENLNFAETGVKEALQKNIMILWNVFKFYEMYEDNSKFKSRKSKVVSENILDKWILARLNQLIAEVTESMEKYNLPRATRPITDFINDFSTWYLRRSRERFKLTSLPPLEKPVSPESRRGGGAKLVGDRDLAIATTRFVLTELSKVMAPFTPFIAEQIWQKAAGHNFKDENRSVHLEAWPGYAEASAGKPVKILEEMQLVRRIVELGLAERDKAGIKVRQPLQKFSIFNFQFSIKEEYLYLIKDELNVLEVAVNKGEGEERVKLDTVMTDELKLEGLKREVVRLVNNLRKNAGLTIKDKIILSWQSDSAMVKKVFAEMAEELKKDTLSERIMEGGGQGKEAKVNGENVILLIKKNNL